MRRRTPSVVFVNSVSDLSHDAVTSVTWVALDPAEELLAREDPWARSRRAGAAAGSGPSAWPGTAYIPISDSWRIARRTPSWWGSRSPD